MKRFTVAVVALTGCILGPACQALVGIEDRVEAPLDDASIDTSASADGSTGDADLVPNPIPAAGCPDGCLPPAPGGWTGPSAVYDGAEPGKPQDCPATYPQKELETHQGLTAAPATCECGGSTVTGRMCKADVRTYPAGCGMIGGSTNGTVTTKDCFATTAVDDFSYQVTTPVLVPGTCTYPDAKTALPPLSFQKVEVACGVPQPTACATRADACITAPFPDAPYGRLCIHKTGEVQCPSVDYAVRLVAYSKVDDARACTACTATPAGGACGTKWGTRTKLADCGSAFPAANDKDANGCYTYTGAGTVVDITVMAPSDGTCTATGGAATGTASSIEPVTYCCNF